MSSVAFLPAGAHCWLDSRSLERAPLFPHLRHCAVHRYHGAVTVALPCHLYLGILPLMDPAYASACYFSSPPLPLGLDPYCH